MPGKHNAGGCCSCDVEQADTPCTNCTDTPKYLEVNFQPSAGTGTDDIGGDFTVGPGLSDNGCNACENLQDKYIIEQTSACGWRVDLCNCNTRDPNANLTSNVNVMVTKVASDYFLQCEINVEIRTSLSTGTQDKAIFKKNLGTAMPNCRSFSGQVLPFDSPTIDGSVCSGWGGQVTVDAVNGPADDDDRQCPHIAWQQMPSQYTMRVNGTPSDSGCDCTDLGGEVTVSRYLNTFPVNHACCDWRGTYVGDCTWTYHMTVGSGRVDAYVQANGNQANFEATGLPQPVTANTPFSCDFTNDGTPVGNWCTGWGGTTMEIVPV